MNRFHRPARVRVMAAAGSIAALTGATLAAPAVAAPLCVLEVTTAAEYVAALECASDEDQAVTISLLTDIALPDAALPFYDGRHDLTINGNSHTVTSVANDEELAPVGLFLAAVPAGDAFQSNNITIANVTVQGFEPNTAAVLAIGTGPLTISDSTFANIGAPADSADGFFGAATVLSFSSTVVENSTFANNTHGAAGAVSVENFGGADSSAGGATLTVSNSTFTGNHTTGDGGAINSAVPLTVTGSTFVGNSADGGGAILARSGLHVRTSSFVDNHSELALVYSEGDLTVQSSTFADNVSHEDSTVSTRALSKPVLVENSTFTNNVNPTGALYVWNTGDAGTTVRHSTFADNSGEDGAHLMADSENLIIEGSVFTGAEGAAGCDIFSAAAASHNFDADGSCTGGWAGEGNIGEGIDAQLGSLANNGGPTRTLLPLDGSPLIDAIPTTADAAVTSDQRGTSRPQGLGYDIGSVEVEAVVEDDDDDVDDTDAGAGLVNFQIKTDGGVLYGTATAAVAVTDINWTATSQLTGAPANTALPYGAAGFTVEVPEPSASVTITLTAPAPFTSVYKVSGDTWTAIPGATFSADGTTVTYTLTDGGDLDEDGQANGYIVDPVALAVQATFTG